MTTFLILLSCSITFHLLLLAAASSEGLDPVPFLVYRFSNWYDLGNVILKKTLLKRFEVDSILQFWVSQTICFSDGFISTLFEVLYLLPHCFWCDT